jgi:hypothetical protein
MHARVGCAARRHKLLRGTWLTLFCCCTFASWCFRACASFFFRFWLLVASFLSGLGGRRVVVCHRCANLGERFPYFADDAPPCYSLFVAPRLSLLLGAFLREVTDARGEGEEVR